VVELGWGVGDEDKKDGNLEWDRKMIWGLEVLTKRSVLGIDVRTNEWTSQRETERGQTKGKE
jgi:hypothetical protein